MKSLSLKQLSNRLQPYKDLIIFMVTLVVANYFWKWTFNGDEDGSIVTWLGLNVTAIFDVVSRHVAYMVYRFVAIFRDTVYMPSDRIVRFESGVGSVIIWGCSGLKQTFIWTCLILTVKGGWKHKLWYIPLGWVCCYVFNILRIGCTLLLIEHHREWFPILHDVIFKYAFYTLIFLLWLIFVEKIRSNVSQR